MNEKFVAEIRSLLGDEYEVDIQKVTKNNGVTREGIMICKVGAKVKPTIYPSDDMTPQDVVDIFHKNDGNDITRAVDTNDIFSREYVLKNVTPTLVSRDRNAERLKDLLHTPYADLEIMYRVAINSSELGEATYLLRQEHLASLGVTAEEVYDAAIENMQGKGEVTPIVEVLAGLIPCDDDEAESSFPMQVITTFTKTNGAGAIFDKEVVRKLHERLGDEFYILPSSIHELIAVPKTDDSSSLENMVKEINGTMLEENDILSDTVYVFKNERMEVA